MKAAIPNAIIFLSFFMMGIGCINRKDLQANREVCRLVSYKWYARYGKADLLVQEWETRDGLRFSHYCETILPSDTMVGITSLMFVLK